MQRTLIALGCALALGAGGALAQQAPQGPGDSSSSGQGSGGTLTEKAKQAARTLEQKTRQTAEKVKEKVEGTGSSGTSGSTAVSARADQMQRQADADYKSAKAQCEPLQQEAQKTLCEKQATARHANAEVEVQKARMADQGGSTSAMGAGKASR